MFLLTLKCKKKKKKGSEPATELQLSTVSCELATGAIVVVDVGFFLTDNAVKLNVANIS